MFHAVPLLWRVHRMHHADLDFDVTTGVRFHPLETLLSLAVKLRLVAVLGPPGVAMLIFEVALNRERGWLRDFARRIQVVQNAGGSCISERVNLD
jgi:hypothetical protein